MMRDVYFNWMCDLVDARRYSQLLSFLHTVEFTYDIPNDGNRAADGVELRYRFGREFGYSDAAVCAELDTVNCSVLEMMVALANRCEEQIMSNTEYGNRTGKWFHIFLTNLGLDGMTDGYFDIEYASSVIERFINHEYDRNGRGGLVTTTDDREDMRTIEIWNQLMRYLVERYSNEWRLDC